MFPASATSEKKPSLYIFFGDDAYSMEKIIQEMIVKLGTPDLAALNITRFADRVRVDDLRSAAFAMPFLTERRLVVVSPGLALVNQNKGKDTLLPLFESLPVTTGLVLTVLTEPEKKDWREFKRDHWLRTWAAGQPAEKVFTREFIIPNAQQMRQWVIEEARRQGGQIVPAAATELANLCGSNQALAAQELIKLLTYVDYKRAIEIDDVKELVADEAPVSIFALVDAMAEGRRHSALQLLHTTMAGSSAEETFGMIIRQIRLLLLARELMDCGARKDTLAVQLKIHPFVAEKLEKQAQRFSLHQLETLFSKLLEIDEQNKTGLMELPLSLDIFLSEFSQ